ncbi:MAG: NAD(P)/FAD-dependent oxidoreductase [Aridibacter famidurans]|nr:NAD(P)/FAD-dependent oxidoreductase [Aridibacter famidurans]
MQQIQNSSKKGNNAEKKVVIIGGGPAGLTAAYELCKEKVRSVVLEKDTVVGGISRTVNYKGFLFDIGGHRFFTKVKVVDDMWREVMGEEKFLRRSRLSRIYYKKKFFFYPLKAGNALMGLGLLNSFLMMTSYMKAQVFPVKPEKSFEDWICNRFGRRLYDTFFKTYTEKVWGIPCEEISADWAAQRIKGLSLIATIKNAILSKAPKSKSEVITTLIDAFDYPEKGPGQMWEIVAEKIQEHGSELHMKANVEKIFWEEGRITALQYGDGTTSERIEGTDFISSMPMRELVKKLDPPPPDEVLEAADALGYRDFLTVSLIVNKPKLFSDNWIYIHDSSVQVGRIQNFKNWSPHMVPDPSKTCLGLEYFCFEGDGLWTKDDKDLIEQAKRELETLGLVAAEDVEDGSVVRMPKAYPVYDGVYQDAVNVIREFLTRVPNMHLVGRNGMHKYNNQDHSMLTAMLAVRNILGANYDVWEVNVDKEYHEEMSREEAEDLTKIASTQPLVPKRIS